MGLPFESTQMKIVQKRSITVEDYDMRLLPFGLYQLTRLYVQAI